MLARGLHDARPRAGAARCGRAILTLLLAGWAALTAAADNAGHSMRLRIEWGGGAERVWEGQIAVTHGTLSEPAALGIEADEPGSMWLDDNGLTIRQRSPHTYDGVDIWVDAAVEEQLVIQLHPAGKAPAANGIRVPLAQLLGDTFNNTLDAQGNRLLVRRSPGDKLRVVMNPRPMIFVPGETFQCELQTHLLPAGGESRVRIGVQLVDPRGTTLWSNEQVVRPAQPNALPLAIPLPNKEGVYEVQIAATGQSWQQAVRAPLGGRPIAERKIQLLVLDSRPLPLPATARDGERVFELDPASPRWWDRLGKWPSLARWRRGPLSNGNLQVQPHALGPVAQLGPNRAAGDPNWEAYFLPVTALGAPHVLEVEYPSDVPQSLGISLLEPNAAGALTAVGIDSGVSLEGDVSAASEPAHWERHRILFWPRTHQPLVLFYNRSERQPAVYGKLRVLALGEHLARANPAGEPAAQRLWAAYLDRPLFARNFGAAQALDAWSGHSLDDWGTFYDGGTRLVEYLQHVGYGGLMLAVLADGSTLYPSALLDPTPRHDTGALFDTAQDPLRKDVLEMLLRLFDREQLQFIPALDFSSPLPRLEELRRRGGLESEGLEWVNAEGQTWSQARADRPGGKIAYNLLAPRVQDALLDVIREVVQRYAGHPALGGLGLTLSADGYAQLPGPEWGLDDATLERFQRDTGLRVPGAGPARFAERGRYLAEDGPRRAWLQWRCEQLQQFYRRVRAELSALRPDARLYLNGANMLSGVDLENDLRPTLPRQTTFTEALLAVGIDPRNFQADPGIVLLRSQRVIAPGRLGAQAVDLELQQMGDAERVYQESAFPAGLFFHVPQKLRLPSFDEKCPFRPAASELLAQPAPSGRENRRRFVRCLATLDPAVLFDGGALLPLGQEDALRDLVALFRKLPAVRFQRAGDAAGSEACQAVTVRYATFQDQTYAYAVNDAPFAAALRVDVEAGADCRLEELTGRRKVAGLAHDGPSASWSVDLEPYDVVAIRLSQPNVRLARPVVAAEHNAEGRLAARIRGLGVRSALLSAPPPLVRLRNAGFETAANSEGAVPGWTFTRTAGAAAQIETARPHSGNAALHLSSTGPAAVLDSEPFEAPATGRIAMSVWLRITPNAKQPPLRLTMDARHYGEVFCRCAYLGLWPGTDQVGTPIAQDWAQYIVQMSDLPLDGLSNLRIRFELLGPGDVWIDDVELNSLNFSKKERVELSKLIALADVQLQNGRLGDCLRLLDGYWPRFLETYVPLPGAMTSIDSLAGRAEAARCADPPPADAQTPPAEKNSLLDRFKSFLPRHMR